jgi:hypothetical protein
MFCATMSFVMMRRRSAAIRLYLKFAGSITAYSVGLIDRYSPQHRRFLASGFTCAGCQSTLLNDSFIADIRCYDCDGKYVHILEIRRRGSVCECPRCGHRWPLRRSSANI